MSRLFLLCVTLVPTLSAHAGSIQTWTGNGHTYEIVEETVSWTAAKTSAQSRTYLGQTGYLASITSQAEQDFIFLSFNQPGLHALWIGLTSDPALGGLGNPGIGGSGAPYWIWLSGESTGYVNWVKAENGFAYNEPNNFFGIDFYTELVFTNTDGTPGRWNDTPDAYFDGNKRYFLVEYNTAVPEPSSFFIFISGILLFCVACDKRKASA